MKNIIAASTSTLHGSSYLDYILPQLSQLFSETDTVLFIPYARPDGISYDKYTQKAAAVFKTINKKLRGIHEFENPVTALHEAQGIFIGGGNTFVLVNTLHQHKIMQVLREVILNGTPYLGTSAGSNICGVTMQTTNDMPIVYPPSFKTTGVIPFNINAHYLDPDPNSKHMGETRETRIKEYHSQNTVPVVGLREGSWLEVHGDSIVLKGNLPARVFKQNQDAFEVETNTDLQDLIL